MSETPRQNALLGLLSDASIPSPIAKNDDAHFAALGRFVVDYATAEAVVHMLARALSGMSDEKARAVFGGMRLSDIAERVRAMLRINNAPPETFSEVDACLSHLDVIAERRHKIVHRSVAYDGIDSLQVTNILTAKSLASVELEVFKKEDLEAMSEDCQRIFLRLTYVENPSKLALVPETFPTFLRRPWRYTPPPRASRKKQLPKARTAQPLPQPSSAE